jgi:hypothetical protein
MTTLPSAYCSRIVEQSLGRLYVLQVRSTVYIRTPGTHGPFSNESSSWRAVRADRQWQTTARKARVPIPGRVGRLT